MVTRDNLGNACHNTHRNDMMNRCPPYTTHYTSTNILGSSPYIEVQQRLNSFLFCRPGSKQNFLTFANAGFCYYDWLYVHGFDRININKYCDFIGDQLISGDQNRLNMLNIGEPNAIALLFGAYIRRVQWETANVVRVTFLQDWRLCEDPLLQHIKVAPRCPVVISLVGENIVHEFMSDESGETRKTTTPREQAHAGRFDTETPLLSPAAQSVLEHGYSKETVISAIRKVQNGGRRHFTALELLNIIFDEEENHV